MTDRAKKISELQATTSVANTDKLVVLKDPAGTPLTRSVTANVFALSIAPIARADIPGANVSVGNVSIASNGTSNVTFLTIANSKFYEVTVIASDAISGDRAMAKIIAAANDTEMMASVDNITVGTNEISIDHIHEVNAIANTTSLVFWRGSATTANVNFKYRLTTYT